MDELRRILLPRTPVNMGAIRALSEVAQLAGLEPLQYQLEGPRADARPAGEGVLRGTYGEQHQPEQVREAHRSHPREHQDDP
jgi:hypothetical protein